MYIIKRLNVTENARQNRNNEQFHWGMVTKTLHDRVDAYAIILPRREVRIAPVHEDIICCTAVISSKVPPGITLSHGSPRKCGDPPQPKTWRNVCCHTWTSNGSKDLGHENRIFWRSSPIPLQNIKVTQVYNNYTAMTNKL